MNRLACAGGDSLGLTMLKRGRTANWLAKPSWGRSRSVEVFRERANAGRGAQDVGVHLGYARNDGDGPALRNARLVLQHRADMAGDNRPARFDCRGSAVELGNTETPDFLLVGRFKREHGALLCSRD